MVRARSTVSMARTTPAQKPRGEQSTILRSGLAAEETVILSDLGGESALAGGGETANSASVNGELRVRDTSHLGPLSAHVKALQQTIAPRAPNGLYRPQFPSSLMTTGFAQNRRAKHKGDLP